MTTVHYRPLGSVSVDIISAAEQALRRPLALDREPPQKVHRGLTSQRVDTPTLTYTISPAYRRETVNRSESEL